MARLSGTIGTVAVPAGPGLTNTVTAIKNAQMAESPILLLGTVFSFRKVVFNQIADVSTIVLLIVQVVPLPAFSRVVVLFKTLINSRYSSRSVNTVPPFNLSGKSDQFWPGPFKSLSPTHQVRSE